MSYCRPDHEVTEDDREDFHSLMHPGCAQCSRVGCLDPDNCGCTDPPLTMVEDTSVHVRCVRAWVPVAFVIVDGRVMEPVS